MDEIIEYIWADDGLQPPRRSLLVGLEPIGAATPMIESLTGYVARVAAHHRVSAGVLIGQEIAPLLHPAAQAKLANEHKTRSRQYNRAIARTAWSINGAGSVAVKWAIAMNALTLRSDLEQLTMLPWKNLLSEKKLCRSWRAWCPLCLIDWRVLKKDPYEPLLWKLSAVVCCPLHHVLLSEHCPACEKTMNTIHYIQTPGHCQKCGEDLSHSPVRPADPTEVHRAAEVGTLLALSSSGADTARWLPIGPLVRLCTERFAAGNTAALARQTGFNYSTLWYWNDALFKPALEHFLQLATTLDIPLADLVYGKLDFTCERTLIPLPVPHKTRHPIDKQRLRTLLEKQLSVEPAPSLKEAAARVGRSTDTLRKTFPDLTRAVSKRYKDLCSVQRRQREQQQVATVERIALELLSQGFYPSLHRMLQRLEHPGILRLPQSVIALQQIRAMSNNSANKTQSS